MTSDSQLTSPGTRVALHTCIAQVFAVLLLDLLDVRINRARDVDEAISLNLEVTVG